MVVDVNKEIEKWKKKLLDLSKRNVMLSYRDTQSGTIEVIAPDMKSFFDDLCDAKVLQVYDLNEQDDEDFLFEEETDTFEKSNSKENYLMTYA